MIAILLILGLILFTFIIFRVSWLLQNLSVNQQKEVTKEKKQVKQEERLTDLPQVKKSSLGRERLSKEPLHKEEKIKSKTAVPLKTDKQSLKQAIIMSEILKRPKGW